MALDDQASKGTKFGATPDNKEPTVEVVTTEPSLSIETDEDANKRVADMNAASKETKKERDDKLARGEKFPLSEKNKDNGDDNDNDGSKPVRSAKFINGDAHVSINQPQAQKNENDEQKELLRQIRDSLNPPDNRHPLMKKLDEDMKGYSNRTAEFRAGYEFGYKVSYGLVRAVELAFKGMKWAATLKKAEAGVTAVQGSAAGLSGDSQKVMEQAGVSQSKDGVDKKGPEQKKDKDNKAEGPKKDESPVAKTKFGGGMLEGVKSVVEQVKKKAPDTPKQKQPRKPKGKSFG